MKIDLAPYWQRLQPREQRLLQLLGAVIAVLLLYVVVVRPFVASREELVQDVASRSKLQQLVSSAAQQKQRLSGIGGGANRARVQNLAQLIRDTATQQQLGNSLGSVEAVGQERVKVSFAEVSFVAVNTWLQTLAQQYGLQVRSLQAQDKGHNGNVDLDVEVGY